jgi:hypothetical protein
MGVSPPESREHLRKRVDLRLVYSRCLTPVSSQSRRALLSRQIRRARRRVLPNLVMRALVDRFKRTLDDDASARRRLLPLSASGTLAFALPRLLLLWWCTEYIHLLLMELTRRAAELPRDTRHHCRPFGQRDER